MTETKCYEQYPWHVVLRSNLLNLTIYVLGFYILLQFHWILALLFLAYVIALEIRIVRYHCVNCYYYGKTCGFGKGRISVLFFKQGEASRFCAHEMTWKDMIPDMLIFAIPLLAAIVLLIIDFNIITLGALLLLILCTTMGNQWIRGSLTCKYCKQREIGCPAEKLFNKHD